MNLETFIAICEEMEEEFAKSMRKQGLYITPKKRIWIRPIMLFKGCMSHCPLSLLPMPTLLGGGGGGPT